MMRQGIVTGLSGARSWPGARVEEVPRAVSDGDGALYVLALPHVLALSRRRPSGARFRSRGRHAERRGARRTPGTWPYGRHAPSDAQVRAAAQPPAQVRLHVSAAVRDMACGARWAGRGLAVAPNP